MASIFSPDRIMRGQNHKMNVRKQDDEALTFADGVVLKDSVLHDSVGSGYARFGFRIFGSRHLRLFAASPVWLALVFSAASACAADWPRLGGPGATWVSLETNLARTWPAEG